MSDKTFTITVKYLRKKLKPLGFTIKTKSLSIGVYGSIHRISDGKKLPEMFFNDEEGIKELQSWKPVVDVIQGMRVVTDSTDRVFGVWSGTFLETN